MNIAETLKQHHHQQQADKTAAALLKYRQIIAGDPAEHVAELADVATVLGLSAEEVEAHHRAVLRIRELRAVPEVREAEVDAARQQERAVYRGRLDGIADAVADAMRECRETDYDEFKKQLDKATPKYLDVPGPFDDIEESGGETR